MPRQVGTTGRAAIVPRSEFERLLVAIKCRTYPARDRAIACVSFYLGLRAKEIAALRLDDIYTRDGEVRAVLHLRPAYSKKGRMRDVYMSSEQLRSALSSYRLVRQAASWSEPLFPTRTGRHFTPNGMVQLFRDMYAQAGIEGASSHSGRRTMITRLAEMGVDLKAIATLAGHASIATTCIYVENNPARLARIMGQVDFD
ncbi:site-specific integrase [Alsobacter soli]|uniref:Site-specific integrase n=1 Tax=Alsobacter soli TaxID=2109933 RepID=A0A2T1HTC6_9HYPH|nr:site-specific integrase [Alsobacter soli]PSC04911.1 site-specific integrase [Alsobacter soli]